MALACVRSATIRPNNPSLFCINAARPPASNASRIDQSCEATNRSMKARVVSALSRPSSQCAVIRSLNCEDPVRFVTSQNSGRPTNTNCGGAAIATAAIRCRYSSADGCKTSASSMISTERFSATSRAVMVSNNPTMSSSVNVSCGRPSSCAAMPSNRRLSACPRPTDRTRTDRRTNSSRIAAVAMVFPDPAGPVRATQASPRITASTSPAIILPAEIRTNRSGATASSSQGASSIVCASSEYITPPDPT